MEIDSTSTRSSPVHAASLVDPASHSPALLELIDIELTKPVIEYIVDCVSETVDYAMGRTPSPPSPHGRGRSHKRSPYGTKFTTFVSTVLERAEVTAPTVLTTLVYIHRARAHLSIALEEWALERVFLGALIVASKYTNDSTLKNVHWALCTGVFGKRDVGRIEREFLDVLDWELGVGEADLLAHHAGLMAKASPPIEMKAAAPTPVLLDVPRSKTHHRRVSTGVPELEPSSPQSSLASLSPRTPAHSPAPHPHAHHAKDADASYPKHSAHDADVPMDVTSPSPSHPALHPTLTQGRSSGGRFHDLLRAFPIPIPRHAHRHGAYAISVAA
ncbi:hypothetical protein C8R44DRAFT_606832 [Mycena epipterygia]|nr:hypothetical protein C8R44DRAFT_606832 [Mycena epipterygia]